MKFGPRKPSFKRSIKARTTGKIKRQAKKAVNPMYGKKGMGWVNNPKKAAYNKIYNKTSFDSLKGLKSGSSNRSSSNRDNLNFKSTDDNNDTLIGCLGCSGIILFIISLFVPPLLLISIPLLMLIFIQARKNEKEKKDKEEEAARLYGIYEKKSKLIEMLEDVSTQIEQAKSITTLKSFFNKFEDLNHSFDEATIFMAELLQEEDVLTKEEFDEVQDEYKEETTKLLKDFIFTYEEMAFNKAIQLKTEKGQRNNYQRSYDDLYHYSHYFTPEIEKYIEERWQEI